MSISITRRDLQDAYKYANRSLSRARDYEGNANSTLGKLTRTAEVLAGATAVGVASGRFGANVTVGGAQIPVDLSLGLAGQALAHFVGGNIGAHVLNVSDGVLAGYFLKVGVGLGKGLREKAGAPPLAISGSVDVVGGDVDVVGALVEPQLVVGASPLTEAELASLAQQVR